MHCALVVYYKIVVKFGKCFANWQSQTNEREREELGTISIALAAVAALFRSLTLQNLIEITFEFIVHANNGLCLSVCISSVAGACRIRFRPVHGVCVCLAKWVHFKNQNQLDFIIVGYCYCFHHYRCFCCCCPAFVLFRSISGGFCCIVHRERERGSVEE